MLIAGFEPAISEVKGPQAYFLERTAKGWAGKNVEVLFSNKEHFPSLIFLLRKPEIDQWF